MKPLIIDNLALENGAQKNILWNRQECIVWTANFFLGTCVLFAARVALPICTAFVANEYGWNKNQSGIVLSSFFWGYASVQIIAGAAADSYGGERILQITTLFWAILTYATPQFFDLAYRFLPDPLVGIVLVRVMLGLTQGFHMPSLASVTSRHLMHTEKGHTFGICLAGSHLGTVIAGVFGSALLTFFGWRALFQFVGFISLLWWYLFYQITSSSVSYRKWFLSPETLRPESSLISALKKDMHKVVPTNKTVEVNSNTSVPWKILFSHPAFWAAGLAQYCGANAYYTMFSWLPTYFSDIFPTAEKFIYNVVPHVAIVITSFSAPFIASQLDRRINSLTKVRKIMESLSLAGMAISLFIVAYSNNFYTSLLMFTFAMSARGLHHGGVSVNPCDFAPSHTGAVYGVFNAFSSVTGFIGVFVAGYILHTTGNNWDCVFKFTGLQCVVGALVYAYFGTATKII